LEIIIFNQIIIIKCIAYHYNNGNGLTNIQVLNKAEKLKLPNFKYYSRDELVGKKCNAIECGVVNLDDSSGEGTHHVAYWREGNSKYYFDSFGAPPPKELIKYLGKNILFSTYQVQQHNETNCSEWCLYVLNELNKGREYMDVITNIVSSHKIY
jgi:hypothetical protein